MIILLILRFRQQTLHPRPRPEFCQNLSTMLTRFRFLILGLFLSFGVTAQDCTFQLVLEDSFGDGWDGAELTINVGGVVNTYTVTDDPAIDNGFTRILFIPVTNGETVEIGFVEGGFPGEHSFQFLDNSDEPLYTSTSPIEEGALIFTTTVECITCFAPPANSIEFFRVRSTTVDYKHLAGNPDIDPLYLVEYRLGAPFDPAVDMDGITFTTLDTMGRVNSLMPDTTYAFWISTICQTEMDTTIRRGPFLITTQKRVDVGVSLLTTPLSDCDLGSEEVSIGITNYGGEPQAFFNVDYQINGQPAGVSRPDDGIFTGIVGVDSTEFFTFDTRALLSAPGIYELTLWTELEGDEDPSNDTVRFSVTHTPLISDLPYVENFEGSDGFWSATKEETANGDISWEWGQPSAPNFNSAPQGVNAWATSLDGRYNNNEISYLNSPCFDLTTQTEDPLFSAIMIMDLENNFEQFTLEMTKDEGETWEKITTGAGTINWYNNIAQQFWTNNGGFNNPPVMVSAVLPGAAGEEIQLRFRFRSDGSVTREGIVLDVVSLTTREAQDLAAVVSTGLSTETCGSAMDTVRFSFTNRGTETAIGFDVNYRINGGAVVTEAFPDEVVSGASTTYQFLTPFNATESSVNEIEAWVSLMGDAVIANDTTVSFFRPLEQIPFFEDFETSTAPSTWDLDGDLGIFQSNGSPSIAITDNLFSGDTDYSFRTANYGLVEAGDKLVMDFFFRPFSGEGVFEGLIDIEVRAYPDCGEDFDVLEDFTAVGDTSLNRDISDYAGRSLRFEVVANWIEGDFFFNTDNFGVVRCAGLGLDIRSIALSDIDAEDGEVSVNPTLGFAPYTFEWSTGDTTARVDSLLAGDYSVIVTDAFGCSSTEMITVDLTNAADEPTEVLEGISVFPNPTEGRLELQLDLEKSTSLQAGIYDMTGRQLISRNFGRQLQLNESFDLSAFPAGVYLLRIQADDAARTVRIVKR